MPAEIGEARETWGRDVCRMAEEFANNLKNDKQPFYVVYAAKPDKADPRKFRQAFRFYRQRPPKLIGILVWYCDHSKSLFQFVPELSIPPDVPLDPSTLSQDSKDQFPSVMAKGEELNVLLS